MTVSRRTDLLASIASRRTLVVGDAMLDEYVWGTAERVSPEAPVLVLRAGPNTAVPGGAANVIACLRALGARAGLVAVSGDDAAGSALGARLAELGCDPLALVRDSGRPTTVKTRILAGNQQVVRVDREDRSPLPPLVAAELQAATEQALAGCDSLLLSDYDKGVLTPQSIPPLVAAAKARGAFVSVNAKPHYAAAYAGVDLLTVNRVEAAAISGLSPTDLPSAAAAATRIGEQVGCPLVLVTLGPDGAVLWQAGTGAQQVPPVSVPVFDPAGAGDTTFATLHLALTAGAPPREAAALAMLAAAVVVRKVGVATAAPAEILALAESG
ncbi:MAG: hypothetical protein IT204_01525 [Fimbriimonadaceae bacterium]|nr:hypothetical protein [Fimbriimonadaceae bacterium]